MAESILTETKREAAPPSARPVLEVAHIAKQFPGVLALDGVSVAFYPGEVHAVVGENGAGKSTLMKVLAGAIKPDGGELMLDGHPVAFNHPSEAQQAGISIIYQEFNLLPERTVAENIFLGREPHRFGVIDYKQLEADTLAVLERLEAQDLISPTAQRVGLPEGWGLYLRLGQSVICIPKALIMG